MGFSGACRKRARTRHGVETTLVVKVGPPVANVVFDQVSEKNGAGHCQHEAPPEAAQLPISGERISKQKLLDRSS